MSFVNIVRIIAIIVAVVAAFVAIPFGAAILAILGLVVGFMGVQEDRRLLYLVMAVALSTVAGSLGGVPLVGEHVSAILGNFSAVINAGAVAVILTLVYERVTE